MRAASITCNGERVFCQRMSQRSHRRKAHRAPASGQVFIHSRVHESRKRELDRNRISAMVGAAREAPVRFLSNVFEPTDWIAVFLKSYVRRGVAQRVGPVSWIQGEPFQRWLRAMNARNYDIFVSVNAIVSGRRSRTRDAIGAVRHVFLDADHDGRAVLSRIDARRDLPSPNYVLHSSPNHVHVFWRVVGFDCDRVERLQKQLAHELQTDPAATPVTQNTRLPGFFNHKRPQPHLVTVEYLDEEVQLRERSLAWMRDADAPKVRLVSALVTTRVGPVLLRREFHIPDSAPDVPARTQEDELMKA